MALSEEKTAKLFLKGSMPAESFDPLKRPPYTALGPNCSMVLTTKEFSMAVFVAAFRDFFISCIRNEWKIDPLMKISQDKWRRHLHDCLHMLRVQKDEFEEDLTPAWTPRRIHGKSAELCLSMWVEALLDCFGPQTEVIMPVWKGDEQPQQLGCNYVLEAISRTNARIFLETRPQHGTSTTSFMRNGRFVTPFIKKQNPPKNFPVVPPGEVDAIIFTHGKKELILMDITTSTYVLNAKLDVGEGRFMEFRRSMMNLFQESNGKQGFRHVGKMHVVGTENRTHASNVLVNTSEPCAAVMKLEFAMLPITRHIGQEAFDQLLDLGALHLQNGRVYSLHENRLPPLEIAPT